MERSFMVAALDEAGRVTDRFRVVRCRDHHSNGRPFQLLRAQHRQQRAPKHDRGKLDPAVVEVSAQAPRKHSSREPTTDEWMSSHSPEARCAIAELEALWLGVVLDRLVQRREQHGVFVRSLLG